MCVVVCLCVHVCIVVLYNNHITDLFFLRLHFIVFPRFHLSVNFFYLGQAIDGICGSVFAVLIASFSISADISVGKSNRIIWIVVLLISSEVIISSTSIVTGYLVDILGFSVALIFLICPTILALLLIIFLMPETGPGTDATKHQNQNICTLLVRIVRMYTSEGNFRHRMSLFLCLILFFLVAFNILTISSIDTLYQMHEPFCWDATLIGYYGAARNAGQALLAGLLLKVGYSSYLGFSFYSVVDVFFYSMETNYFFP